MNTIYQPHDVKILIADDEDLVRASIRQALEEFRFNVIGEAWNGKDLIEKLKEMSPDIVMLDLAMPLMTGKQAFEIIRKEYPAIKVAIVTSFQDDALAVSYIKGGASAFLVKAMFGDPLRLASALLDIAEKGYYLNNLPAEAVHYTGQETAIISLMLQGREAKEIAGDLAIAGKTVHKHQRNIIQKSSSRNISHFIVNAVKKGYEFLLGKN